MNLISTPNNLLNSLEEFKSNSHESSLSKKVLIEKRKRHQAYITIDYLLGFWMFRLFAEFSAVENTETWPRSTAKNSGRFCWFELKDDVISLKQLGLLHCSSV
jgi:hypothetical protein